MKIRFCKWTCLLVLMPPLLLLALENGDVDKGKEVYRRCAPCHGDSGEGNEAIGKMFGVKMPELGSKEVQSLDDAAIRKIILEGKGKMKPVNLSDPETENVIAFLRSLKK